MTRVLVLLTLPAVIGWSTLWASPSTALDTVQEANTTYRSALSMTERGARLEEFRRAERLYGRAVEQAEEEGRSIGADLWVNYGNAAIQAEHLGSAVYAYRRALKLDPNHERARKNLRHARSLLPSWAQPPDTRSVVDTFFFWHQALSSTERQLMAALAFAAAGLLLALSIRTGRSVFRNLSVVPGVIWIGLSASIVIEATSSPALEAVLTAPETIGRSADSPNVAPRFSDPIPGGTEVTILETRSPWIHVELLNGRDAWVKESAATTL